MTDIKNCLFAAVESHKEGMIAFLQDLVRQHGPLPPARAVHFLRQTCNALKEARASGLIHRDIKPANVMIRNGRVVLIDVAFGTVRPSPWRQAVDLANMMVILALRTNSKLVYERALLQFAQEDIAEAFAATRSVTLPSQSRSSLAADTRQALQNEKLFLTLTFWSSAMSLNCTSGKGFDLPCRI